MIPVSVYIITKNCEETLHNTLASVADFAEIILVDSGSTDKTIEIAQAFNCKIYHQAWLGFAKQKQLARSFLFNVVSVQGYIFIVVTFHAASKLRFAS